MVFLSIYCVSCTSRSLYWNKALMRRLTGIAGIHGILIFRSKVKPEIDENKSQRAVNQARVIYMFFAEVKALPIENAGLHRLMAKSPEEAYPENDRPRGKKDFQSVSFHLETTQPVSPITIAELTDSQGKTRVIKLDGVHRLVAAAMLRSFIAVFMDQLGYGF